MPESPEARPSRLRELSRRLVLGALSDAGAMSQADLVRTTGLSRATVASILDELRGQGRVTSDETAKAIGRGRPAALVRLATESNLVIGVDFGHTHLSVAVADLDGTILTERHEPMDVHHAARESLDRAAAVIGELIEEVDAGPNPDPAARSAVLIGVGVPGPIELTNPENGAISSRVCTGNVLPNWAGVDPAAEITARTGLPAIVENDANLGALGEQRFGVGQGVDNLIFVKVASGIGTGMILGGRLYRGARGASGEIGHVQVREDGALCRCGSRGCLETVSSEDAALALLSPAHGRTMTAADLASLEAAGDPGVLRLLSDMGNAVGRIIAVVAANLDPNMVIVGGSMARDALVDSVARAIVLYNQPYVAADMTVKRAALGERASLLGAIAFAISSFNAG